MSVWGQIKQRRITQIVFTYLAGGWMVLAVFDQVVDREVLPLVVYEVALTLYLFGIGIAVIIGWYHGEKGAQRATPVEIALVAVITLAGLGTSVRVVRASMEQDSLADALSDSDLRSIGVLYFEDLTTDGSGGPVADGITEGLIRTLAQVPELDVTSRNGSQRVRDLDIGPDSIASLLGAGTLVDGTVDMSGDEVRVSVRVLEGTSGVPLFRDTYEWSTDEIASAGTELAQEVANALREQLGQEIRLRESRFEAPSSGAWLRQARAERLYKDGMDALGAGDGAAAAQAFAAADTELAEAEAAAPEWAEPSILRGRIAFRQIAFASSLDEAVAALDQAVVFANEALAREPNSAGALELRGSANYQRYLYPLPISADERAETLANARADLEGARDLDGGLASAFSTLSHLYYQVGDLEEAAMAARTAYRQDAFLIAADEVLWRLYSAYYDLEDNRQAREWCLEGNRRFPGSPRFFECQIWLMTMAGVDHDVDGAWSLLEEMRPLMPEATKLRIDATAQMAIGGVIGLAGMADSAYATMERARLTRAEDPDNELASVEAAMHSVLGDTEGAIDLLRSYVLANPGHFGRARRLHWWWRPLQGNAEFEELRALN